MNIPQVPDHLGEIEFLRLHVVFRLGVNSRRFMDHCYAVTTRHSRHDEIIDDINAHCDILSKYWGGAFPVKALDWTR